MEQSEKNPQKTLAISENLELSNVSVPQIPNDILFPNELNQYLRDQVQYLTHENGMLCKNLSETELQLKQSSSRIDVLSSQLDEYQTLCPKNSAADSTVSTFASTKILELSKKLRERASELEIYKTKCSKLEQKILDIEGSIEKSKIEKLVVEQPKPKDELEGQIKSLQDKLNSTTIKLCETRNSNTQLKNDIKLANKLLQQEIGENFDSLQNLINSNTNWRGRAQIICDLQQKNNDLREKLRTCQDREKNQGNTSTDTSLMPTTKSDKRVETLTKENGELKNMIQDFKKKFEAAKARSKVYDSECTALRAKVAILTEQKERDHELITSLTGRASQEQDLQNETVRKKQNIIQKLEQENNNQQLELTKQKYKVENMQAELLEKNMEIQQLHRKLENRQPLHSPRPSSLEQKTISQLEAERLRLLELTKLANDRLESERIAHQETQLKFRNERQKSAKLEAKVARLELDKQTDRLSTYSLKSKDSGNNLEDQLQLAEETIRVLETRLQIERQEHNADLQEFSKILQNYGYVQNQEK